MGDVINLQAERENRTPHITGRAFCISCRHRWVDVSPVGIVWLTCPECKAEMGVRCFHVEHPGPYFSCPCGNELFQIHEQGAYCPNCGRWKHDLTL